jgi:hypothetical protein
MGKKPIVGLAGLLAVSLALAGCQNTNPIGSPYRNTGTGIGTKSTTGRNNKTSGGTGMTTTGGTSTGGTSSGTGLQTSSPRFPSTSGVGNPTFKSTGLNSRTTETIGLDNQGYPPLTNKNPMTSTGGINPTYATQNIQPPQNTIQPIPYNQPGSVGTTSAVPGNGLTGGAMPLPAPISPTLGGGTTTSQFQPAQPYQPPASAFPTAPGAGGVQQPVPNYGALN